MVDRYGERRALTSRFLSPEPLSCSAGRKNGLREPLTFVCSQAENSRKPIITTSTPPAITASGNHAKR